MAKLTDTQLVILTTAAQRDGGAVLPLPKSLKTRGAAVTKILENMCKKGTLEERPAAPGAETWRKTEDGRPMMLVIADTGLAAIDAGPEGKAETMPGGSKKPPGKVGRVPCTPTTNNACILLGWKPSALRRHSRQSFASCGRPVSVGYLQKQTSKRIHPGL